MKNIIFCVFIITICINCYNMKKLPSFIQKCKRADPPEISKCITQRALDLKPYLIKGIPEMKLPPIEPLHIHKLEIHTGNSTSFGFNANFTDIEVYGVKDFQVKELNFDLEKKQIYLHFYIPKLYNRGYYNFNGKMLVLELSSAGGGSVNISDIEVTTLRNISIETRNGKQYVNLQKDDTTDIKYGKISLYFENLFRNNKQLTEQTNKAINDNFEDIAKEVNPLMYESSRLLVLGIIKPVFDDYSLDELFE